MPIETPSTKTPNLYSDFRDDFMIHPIKKDLIAIKDADSVKQSIKNLLLVGPYERRFRPNIGSGLKKYLFELVTPVTATLIRTSIIRVIQTYEPRAELLDVSVTVSPDQNSYSATITFRIINNINPITFTQILERIR
jgi:phage baseplate assembly protein W